MQGSFIIPIHFNFYWHTLFSDEDAEADAKRLTQLFSRKNSLYLHLGIHSGKQVSGSERKASNVKLFTWIEFDVRGRLSHNESKINGLIQDKSC